MVDAGTRSVTGEPRVVEVDMASWRVGIGAGRGTEN